MGVQRHKDLQKRAQEKLQADKKLRIQVPLNMNEEEIKTERIRLRRLRKQRLDQDDQKSARKGYAKVSSSLYLPHIIEIKPRDTIFNKNF